MIGRAAYDEVYTDAVCLNCNMCSAVFMFTIQSTDTTMAHVAMTPESLRKIEPVARRMVSSLNITVAMSTDTSTRIKIQPTLSTSKNSSLKLLGKGTTQFSGSPLDIGSV